MHVVASRCCFIFVFPSFSSRFSSGRTFSSLSRLRYLLCYGSRAGRWQRSTGSSGPGSSRPFPFVREWASIRFRTNTVRAPLLGLYVSRIFLLVRSLGTFSNARVDGLQLSIFLVGLFIPRFKVRRVQVRNFIAERTYFTH